MNNLFSVFDPNALFSLPLNWASSIIIIVLLPSSFWLIRNPRRKVLNKILNFVRGEFLSIFGSLYSPGITFLTVRLFIFIVINNVLGLAPYIFTRRRHLTFTVALALPLWVGHIVFAWVKTPNNMLAHLVPLGTPGPLMPLIVLIELVRRVIRPLTLSVRLAANIVAGHLLLTLLGNQLMDSNFIVLALGLICLILLGTLERAVALIQGYVFRVLSTLYVNEVNIKKFI